MDQHLIQGGVVMLLVVSCYGNWDKLRPDERIGNRSPEISLVYFSSILHQCCELLELQSNVWVLSTKNKFS